MIDIPEITDQQKIDKVRKHQCLNCGGQLRKIKDSLHENIYECNYCSTQYSIKHNNNEYADYSFHPQYTLTVIRPGCRICAAHYSIPYEAITLYGQDEATKAAKHHIVQQIASYIQDNFDDLVELEIDPFGSVSHYGGGTEFRARIKLLERN